MSITDTDIQRVAELARIRIDAASVEEVTRRIGAILGMIDQMQSVDTSAVEPLANPLDAIQRLREDRVSETDCRDQFMAIAPACEQGVFLVPRVIE